MLQKYCFFKILYFYILISFTFNIKTMPNKNSNKCRRCKKDKKENYEEIFYRLDKKRENEGLTDNDEKIEYLKAQMEMCQNNKLTIEDQKQMVYDYFGIIRDQNKKYKKAK